MNYPIYVFEMEDFLEIYQCPDQFEAINKLRSTYFQVETFEEMDIEAIAQVHICTHTKDWPSQIHRVLSLDKFLSELKDHCILSGIAVPSICSSQGNPSNPKAFQVISNTSDPLDISKVVHKGSTLDEEAGTYTVFTEHPNRDKGRREDSYTYKNFAPSDISLIKNSEGLRDLLDMAVVYHQFTVLKISENYSEYLEKFLNISPVEGTLHNYYYLHKEGYINIVSTDIGYTLLLDTEVSLGKQLYEDILKDNDFIRHGLASLLDPNMGGNISGLHREIASEIIFG